MQHVKKGDRVILTDRNYCATKHYPIWGSPLMCVGTALTTTTGMANIQWDNGAVSSQFLGSLTLYNKEKVVDPNSAFLLRKRKSMG